MAHIYISHGIHSEFLNAVVFFHEIVASNSRMFFALFQNILCRLDLGIWYSLLQKHIHGTHTGGAGRQYNMRTF